MARALEKISPDESCPKCGEAKTKDGPARLAINYKRDDDTLEVSE